MSSLDPKTLLINVFQHLNGKYNVDVQEISILSYEQTKQNKNKNSVVDLINSFQMPICLCKQGFKKMAFTFPKTKLG